MARAASEKVGRGVCPMHGCGEPVTFRKSGGGLLTWRCDGCDSSGFMDPRGSAYQRSISAMKPGDGVAPGAPVLVPELPVDTAPARKPKPPAPAARPAFDLGAL